MKINSIYFCAGIILFISGCSCKKETINQDETTASNGQNLIFSESFESNNKLIFKNKWYDWMGNNIDSNSYAVSLEQDAPPNHGNWSLRLDGIGNAPPGIAETYITGQSGNNIYKLNIWMKNPGNANGGASLKIRSTNQTSTIYANTTNWSLYILTDTISIQKNDTIVIKLQAGGAGPVSGSVLFDAVELIKIR